MPNFENEFETLVNSVRFDDRPSETHRRELEEQVLEAWDRRKKAGTGPSGVFYLKRAAMAAGFVIAAGLLYLFWDGNGAGPNGHPAHTADPQRVEQILRQENASGSHRQELLKEIQDVWKLIAAEDVQALTAVVMDGQTAPSVRVWASEAVVKLGDAQTLVVLEKHIEVRGLTKADDPVILTAQQLSARLEREKGD